MRSSRHQVASAACSDLGRRGALQDGGHLADLLRVDPAHDVGHGAAVERRGDEEWRQELGRGGVPELPVRRRALSLLAASHSSAAARQASRHSPQPVRGDQVLARAPGRSPSGRCTTPGPRAPASPACGGGDRSSRWRPARDRASPESPGTARLVVFPLCVGPTTTRDWAVSAARPVEPRHAGQHAEEETARRSTVGGDQQRAQVASPPGPAALPLVPVAGRPVSPSVRSAALLARARRHGDRRRRARPRGPGAGRRRAGSATAYPAVMAASVSTMDRSVALSRCCTRNERWPTFHKAMPRRSCGRRSASVADSDSSSAAASSSPGDWA